MRGTTAADGKRKRLTINKRTRKKNKDGRNIGRKSTIIGKLRGVRRAATKCQELKTFLSLCHRSINLRSRRFTRFLKKLGLSTKQPLHNPNRRNKSNSHTLTRPKRGRGRSKPSASLPLESETLEDDQEPQITCRHRR